MLVAAALGALVNALQPTLEVGGGKASIEDVRDTLLAAFGDDTASGFDAWALGEGLDSGDTLLVADVQLFAEYAVEQGGLGLPGAGNAGEQDNGGSALGGGGIAGVVLAVLTALGALVALAVWRLRVRNRDRRGETYFGLPAEALPVDIALVEEADVDADALDDDDGGEAAPLMHSGGVLCVTDSSAGVDMSDGIMADKYRGMSKSSMANPLFDERTLAEPGGAGGD